MTKINVKFWMVCSYCHHPPLIFSLHVELVYKCVLIVEFTYRLSRLTALDAVLCSCGVASGKAVRLWLKFWNWTSARCECLGISKKNTQNSGVSMVLFLLANSAVFVTRESSYCFQRVLAIAILFVCLFVRLSVTWVDQSKTLQAKITKSSPLAGWNTLVSGTVKLFH